ncbi:DNA-binding FadR family transcriptional regulator [Arthrobacter woluwensis]|uniref:FadR/GntR family transcriptional regulator n=1 Tax=Arthrobacter woluwensis TaxID=156980 RepID=UPI0027872CBF|nr:FadR/GntR family transcriptional regulator [Arthrobacter woluwensis]MDQ0707415.1 DNA-binding FadR family transcriptional regulator [Arthrobacter woluwensis]
MTSLRPATRNIPLSVQIGDQLRENITNGTWPVGTKVPGEFELMKTFETSRNTVRESLRALVHLGLLESRPGDGTYVRSTSELGAVLARRVKDDGSDEVLEVRAGLEIQASRLAATRVTDDQLHLISGHLHDRENAGDAQERLLADIRFHRAIVEASGNPLMAELHYGLEPAILENAKNYPKIEDPAALEQEHRDLLSALQQRDANAAVVAAQAIVDGFR